MKKKKHISEAVIRRLPKYLRHLNTLKKSGVERVSSQKLGDRMGITASQIRQDFSCFGEFGQQGYGYEVAGLLREVKEILGLNKQYQVIIIGAGKLGQALANYKNFNKRGFNIVALFDINPELIGKDVSGIPILSINEIDDVLADNQVNIGVICTATKDALQSAELLKEKGITNIWNFCPLDLQIDDVVIENVHLSDSLYILAYKMKTQKTESEKKE